MVAGARGPVPKRTDQRRRRNEPEGAKVVKARTRPAPDPQASNPEWHPTIRDLFDSLSQSGMAQFYEPSDWAFARLTCDLLSRSLLAEKLPAMLIGSLMADLQRLGVTEGDRRRMRVELERQEPTEPASVSIMEEYRRAAGKGKN